MLVGVRRRVGGGRVRVRRGGGEWVDRGWAGGGWVSRKRAGGGRISYRRVDGGRHARPRRRSCIALGAGSAGGRDQGQQHEQNPGPQKTRLVEVVHNSARVRRTARSG